MKLRKRAMLDASLFFFFNSLAIQMKRVQDALKE
jgi:hypothetical protein